MVRMWVDGEPVTGREAVLDILDHAVLRGDGCFEAMRAYDGEAFAAGEHLDRLARSAAALRITLPDRTELERWVAVAAEQGGDAVVRLIATRGNPTNPAVPPRILLYAEPVPELPPTLRLLPVVAPWHSAGADWALAGVKSLSYAPNMSAAREAHEGGFDDALLVSADGVVLEGSTFTIAWVVDGVLETPGLELAILDSITRRHVLAASEEEGIESVVGVFPLDRVRSADEVMALSTVKEVMAVTLIGDVAFEAGPVTARLSSRFVERTRSRS